MELTADDFDYLINVDELGQLQIMPDRRLHLHDDAEGVPFEQDTVSVLDEIDGLLSFRSFRKDNDELGKFVLAHNYLDLLGLNTVRRSASG